MPSSTPRGGTPRPRRASSPSSTHRAASRPTEGRRARQARRPAAAPTSTGSTAGSVLVTPEAGHEGAWPSRRWWVIGLICLVLAIMLVPTVRRYLDQRQQIAALQEHNVDALSRERARWDDPAFVETQARERLHFVKPGETGYTLATRQNPANAHDTQVVGVDANAAALPWYGKVWGSLQAADRLGAQLQPTPTPQPSGTAPASVPAISDTAPAPSTSTATRRARR